MILQQAKRRTAATLRFYGHFVVLLANEFKFRVTRGGASHDYESDVRVASRYSGVPDSLGFDCGFRCVKPVSR